MLLVRWNPIVVEGRELPVDEIHEGKYEISASPKMRKKLKKNIQKLSKQNNIWTILPGEERVVHRVEEGSTLYWLIEEAKEKMNTYIEINPVGNNDEAKAI